MQTDGDVGIERDGDTCVCVNKTVNCTRMVVHVLSSVWAAARQNMRAMEQFMRWAQAGQRSKRGEDSVQRYAARPFFCHAMFTLANPAA
eukprot:1158483-Pelagomonas_calceolata.AAC.7